MKRETCRVRRGRERGKGKKEGGLEEERRWGGREGEDPG